MLTHQHINPEEARRRVMRHGRAAMVYSILNPGIDHWFDDSADAAVGFVRRGGWWVIAGDPACDAADLPGVCGRLERDAAAEGRKVVYVCCTDALRRHITRNHSHAAIILGAEPVWNPAGWAGRVQSISSLRAQFNRARNKGVVVEPVPVADVPRLRGELGGLIDNWLHHRPLPPLRFLVEPLAIDGIITDRRLWLARREGRPVAFLLASPVPRRNGWLIEQICRRHDAPNGTSELLIDAAMRQWAAEQCDYATLGLVILTPLAGDEPAAQPWWVRTAFGFARIHGRRFYNFDGLERFRVKMSPDRWEPMYVLSNTAAPSLAAFYFAGAAFCGRRSPASVVAEGAMKALATDIARLRRWAKHTS